ncbi:hypothetical protein V6N13_009152 [Hibiscus sabdariffa]
MEDPLACHLLSEARVLIRATRQDPLHHPDRDLDRGSPKVHSDHYIRDCPKAGNRPEISERSAGQSQKGKYSGNQQSVKITRLGTSEVASNREFRTPTKVYHIRTGEEKDAPDIVTEWLS